MSLAMHDILIVTTKNFSIITPTTPRGTFWCRSNVPNLSNNETSTTATHEHAEQIKDDAYHAGLTIKGINHEQID
jgi:hypothetical protein